MPAKELTVTQDGGGGSRIIGLVRKGRFVGAYFGWPKERGINVVIKKVTIFSNKFKSGSGRCNRVTVGVGGSGAKAVFTWRPNAR